MILFQDLMTDQFGNYLCQKIIEVATDEELRMIVTTVLPELIKISMNIHGTRSVQTLVEVLSKKLDLFEQELFKIIK